MVAAFWFGAAADLKASLSRSRSFGHRGGGHSASRVSRRRPRGAASAQMNKAVLQRPQVRQREMCSTIDIKNSAGFRSRQARSQRRARRMASVPGGDELACVSLPAMRSGVSSALCSSYRRLLTVTGAEFRFWHFSDFTAGLRNVCCWGKSGSRDCVTRLPSLSRSRRLPNRNPALQRGKNLFSPARQILL